MQEAGMHRSFRPFRSPWSLLLVVAALVFTMAACTEGPTNESQSHGCQYNATTHTCV
jgi:hypothetical protein